jgi:hypothetical protein
MNKPLQIGRTKVILYTPLDERHKPTGNCRHIVMGELMRAVAGLAICQSEGEDSFYLYYCDENWERFTDTWHQTLEDAKHQAEFEYQGVGATWQQPD